MSRCVVLLLFSWAVAALETSFTIPEATQLSRKLLWDESCQNETYCHVESSEYPRTKIEELLKKMANNKRLIKEYNILTYRSDNRDDYTQICKFNPNREPIHEIIDKNGKMRYVVQSEKYFKQTVQVTKCSEPGVITEENTEYFRLSCKEERLDHKLMVLSEDTENFEFVSVGNGLPVACYCHMEENTSNEII